MPKLQKQRPAIKEQSEVAAAISRQPLPLVKHHLRALTRRLTSKNATPETSASTVKKSTKTSKVLKLVFSKKSRRDEVTSTTDVIHEAVEDSTLSDLSTTLPMTAIVSETDGETFDLTLSSSSSDIPAIEGPSADALSAEQHFGIEEGTQAITNAEASQNSAIAHKEELRQAVDAALAKTNACWEEKLRVVSEEHEKHLEEQGNNSAGTVEFWKDEFNKAKAELEQVEKAKQEEGKRYRVRLSFQQAKNCFLSMRRKQQEKEYEKKVADLEAVLNFQTTQVEQRTKGMINAAHEVNAAHRQKDLYKAQYEDHVHKANDAFVKVDAKINNILSQLSREQGKSHQATFDMKVLESRYHQAMEVIDAERADREDLSERLELSERRCRQQEGQLAFLQEELRRMGEIQRPAYTYQNSPNDGRETFSFQVPTSGNGQPFSQTPRFGQNTAPNFGQGPRTGSIFSMPDQPPRPQQHRPAFATQDNITPGIYDTGSQRAAPERPDFDFSAQPNTAFHGTNTDIPQGLFSNGQAQSESSSSQPGARSRFADFFADSAPNTH